MLHQLQQNAANLNPQQQNLLQQLKQQYQLMQQHHRLLQQQKMAMQQQVQQQQQQAAAGQRPPPQPQQAFASGGGGVGGNFVESQRMPASGTAAQTGFVQDGSFSPATGQQAMGTPFKTAGYPQGGQFGPGYTQISSTTANATELGKRKRRLLIAFIPPNYLKMSNFFRG